MSRSVTGTRVQGQSIPDGVRWKGRTCQVPVKTRNPAAEIAIGARWDICLPGFVWGHGTCLSTRPGLRQLLEDGNLGGMVIGTGQCVKEGPPAPQEGTAFPTFSSCNQVPVLHAAHPVPWCCLQVLPQAWNQVLSGQEGLDLGVPHPLCPPADFPLLWPVSSEPNLCKENQLI